MQQLSNELEDKPTATVINPVEKPSNNGMVMTSEVIYAYMANARVPFECDTWNIHRLLTLLGVIGEFNAPKKKKSTSQILDDYDRINNERQEKIRKMREERERNANKGADN